MTREHFLSLGVTLWKTHSGSLSRLKRGFDPPWGHQPSRKPLCRAPRSGRSALKLLLSKPDPSLEGGAAMELTEPGTMGALVGVIALFSALISLDLW